MYKQKKVERWWNYGMLGACHQKFSKCNLMNLNWNNLANMGDRSIKKGKTTISKSKNIQLPSNMRIVWQSMLWILKKPDCGNFSRQERDPVQVFMWNTKHRECGAVNHGGRDVDSRPLRPASWVRFEYEPRVLKNVDWDFERLQVLSCLVLIVYSEREQEDVEWTVSQFVRHTVNTQQHTTTTQLHHSCKNRHNISPVSRQILIAPIKKNIVW